MPSGGARSRSGPAPDPNALRRGRSDDATWTTLPADGREGDVPDWPVSVAPSAAQERRWAALWQKPQAVEWERQGEHERLAAYVLAFDESIQPGASAGLKTAVLRMEGELGISTPGMLALRWRIGHVAVEAARGTARVADIRDRMNRGA